jgi:hypothetical protein
MFPWGFLAGRAVRRQPPLVTPHGRANLGYRRVDETGNPQVIANSSLCAKVLSKTSESLVSPMPGILQLH